MASRLRAYHRKDAPQIRAVFKAAIAAIEPTDYSAEQLSAWARRAPSAGAVHARCTDGRTTLVAVDTADRVLAYIDLEQDGHIDHLFCDPAAAGTGIASSLYAQVEAVALSAGIQRLYTEASEPARRFFTRQGFQTLERLEHNLNGVLIHNFQMQKRLAEGCTTSN